MTSRDEFGATLAPDTCDEVVVSRTCSPGDPDPLVNTVTATYTAGIQTATAEASDTTNLFQPAVGVTKTCSPDPIEVGEAELCTIVVTNTSSDDTPDLVNGTITDTLTRQPARRHEHRDRRQHLCRGAAHGRFVHDQHHSDGAGRMIPARSRTRSP